MQIEIQFYFVILYRLILIAGIVQIKIVALYVLYNSFISIYLFIIFPPV